MATKCKLVYLPYAAADILNIVRLHFNKVGRASATAKIEFVEIPPSKFFGGRTAMFIQLSVEHEARQFHPSSAQSFRPAFPRIRPRLQHKHSELCVFR